MDRLFEAQRQDGDALYQGQFYAAAPVDDVKPQMIGVLGAPSIGADSFVLTWQAAADNVGVARYEYSIDGGIGYINVGNVLTVLVPNLQAGTPYETRVRAVDVAGNAADPLGLRVTTLPLEVPPPDEPTDPDVPIDPGFVPSAARTVRILPGKLAFALGSHWTLSTAGPVGAKDPNSIIDIPFDWSAWLADIGDVQLSKVEFFVGGGLQVENVVPSTSGGTVLVSGGVRGSSTTVTCRITTATSPARSDDRTVVLQIKDQ